MLYSKEKPEDLTIDDVDVNTNQPKVVERQKKEAIPEGTPEKRYLEQRREKKQQAKDTAQKNKRNCQTAKNTIKKYQQQVRMSRFNSKTGEKEYIADSKRTEIIKKAQQKARQYC